MNIQKIIVVGRVVKDSRFFASKGDKPGMLAFTVAVNSGKGDNARTSYYDVQYRRGKQDDHLQNLAKFIVKGKELFVEGTPAINVYLHEDKSPDGNIVIHSNFVDLGGGGNDSQDRDSGSDSDAGSY